MSVVRRKPGPTDEQKRAFGARLRAAREAAGLTQAQLATRVGVGVNVPTTWESGEFVPTGQVPWLLCDLLGYEVWAGLWGDAPKVGLRYVTEQEIDELAVKRMQALVRQAESQIRDNPNTR